MCQILCFFFFKQKTAYEMRISDWSSDVCSSDLHASAAASTSWRHGLTFFDDSIIRPPPTWRLLPCGAGDPWTVSVTVTDGLWGASAKIGRASCRERVCQDV